jgi:VanZ family protein
VCAFLFTCLYGYFDEIHQLYIPNRTCDYFDMLANAIGALIFVILFSILDRRKDKLARTS